MVNLSSNASQQHGEASDPVPAQETLPRCFPTSGSLFSDSHHCHHCHPVPTCPLVSHSVSQHCSAFLIVEQMKSLHDNSPFVVAISTQHHLAFALAGQRLCPCLCVQLEKCFHPQTRRAPP